MYDRQKKFQKNFFNPDRLSTKNKISWTKEFVLCLHQELAEIMSSIDWKTYHNYPDKYPIESTREEIIDCFKFVLNLMIVWGMDTDMVRDMFEAKSNIVEARLKLK